MWWYDLQSGRRREDRRRQTDDESSVLDSQDVSSADRGTTWRLLLLSLLVAPPRRLLCVHSNATEPLKLDIQWRCPYQIRFFAGFFLFNLLELQKRYHAVNKSTSKKNCEVIYDKQGNSCVWRHSPVMLNWLRAITKKKKKFFDAFSMSLLFFLQITFFFSNTLKIKYSFMCIFDSSLVPNSLHARAFDCT